MNKIVSSYRNRYYIAPVDLADAAETNRLHLIFISPFLFLFGFLDLFLAALYVHTRVRIIVHLLASHVVDGSGTGCVNRLRGIYPCAPRCQFRIFGTGSSDVGQELFVAQPRIECPEGYDPLSRRRSSSLGIRVGSLYRT